MRVTYVARSFLDYRVPVLAELDRLCHGQLHFVTSVKWSPERAISRLRSVLGERLVLLAGERSLGTDMPIESNTTMCIPFQPGLLQAIRRTAPEVTVGDGFFQWTAAPIIYRFLTGTPLVVCYERWARTERAAQWYRRLYRALVLKAVSTVCCNGTLSQEYVRSLGFPAQRITTGHMVADTDNIARKRRQITAAQVQELRQSWQAKDLVFLYVGRLIKIKGLEHLLRAWSGFERLAPGGASLVIVGSGPEERNLRNQTQAAGLKNVVFAGPVEYEDLPRCYASADMFIIPTLEDNWSLVVPEAMACRLPVLCSKYNGCWPELIQEDRNGWVFDPLDAEATLECLRRAAADPAQLRSMGRQGLQIIEAHNPARGGYAIYSACQRATEGAKKAGMAPASGSLS